MGRTDTDSLLTPGFIGDFASIDRYEGGFQIDWANVADSFKNSEGNKVLLAGYPVGNLLDTGKKVSPRVVTTNPAIGLLESTAVENDPTAAKSGYGVICGGVIVTTSLPTPLTTAIQTELRAVGTGYTFQTRTDSRAA